MIQIPKRGNPDRLKLAVKYADLCRAIAYTNILHLCSGDPDRWIRENNETWNQQVTYAEIIIDTLIGINYIRPMKVETK